MRRKYGFLPETPHFDSLKCWCHPRVAICTRGGPGAIALIHYYTEKYVGRAVTQALPLIDGI